MSTPDISAEILVGAAGWASGNHTWSGMTPAFTPNPRTKSANSPSRTGPTATPDNSVENDSDPDAADSTMNPAIRQPVPTCDMTRYRYAARRLARESCSVATSTAVDRDISSHANRNVMTLSATKTVSSAPSRTFSIAPTVAIRVAMTA